jgi:hypothetical protein
MQLTEADILAYAPDPGTAQRGKSLASARHWRNLAGNGRSVWGECSGSGGWYQVAVDLKTLAFKCTCPARRNPCKHSIGLLLLLASGSDAIRATEHSPAWVEDWLQKRDEHFPKTQPAPERSPEHDLALAELRRKNREKRMEQMVSGLAELEMWLADLFRQGLATLEGQAADYWQELSSRMVDAKLGTLARRIRQLPSLMDSGNTDGNWHENILEELGDIYLLAKGFQRLEHLPEPLQDDLLSLTGVNFKKEDLLTLPGMEDVWLVAGQTEEQTEGNLFARRTWLVGEQSKRTCLLLEFAWGSNPYETTWRLGSVLRGEVVFYPSAFPLRVLFKKFELTDHSFLLQNGYPTLSAFASAYAQALASNPWLSPFPAFLEEVVPVCREGQFYLVDSARKLLPVKASEDLGWKMVATGGGRPIGVFGQWNGSKFMPLSAIVNGRFRLLHLAEPLPRNNWANRDGDLPF